MNGVSWPFFKVYSYKGSGRKSSFQCNFRNKLVESSLN